MHEKLIVIVAVFLLPLSGCIAPSYQTTDQNSPFQQELAITAPIPIPGAATPVPVMTEKSDLLIDRISENLTVFYNRKWNTLYQADDLDCSRMSTYIKGSDYYFVEATIPKVVAPDNRRFLINDREYTSDEFYDVSVYVFDTPQDANDFQADVSSLADGTRSSG